MKTRTRRRTTIVIAITLVAAMAAVYVAVTRLGPLLAGSGCKAGAGHAAMPLDPQQAAIAATIAGVAYHRALPAHAVTVAYATALQESHMHNLTYGDRDSVGVFQQRPSEGWGPARKLEDPVYASSRFFAALATVRGYQRLPVYQAAQDVQRSADGYAYAQYQRSAARLASVFTGHVPHAVWCWSGTSGPRGSPRVGAAHRELVKTFGKVRVTESGVTGTTRDLAVRARAAASGWAVAAWMVTHAGRYHFHTVQFDGFKWRASAGSAGWTRDNSAEAGSEVLAS